MDEIVFQDLRIKFTAIYYLLNELYDICFLKKAPKKSKDILNELFANNYIDDYLVNTVNQANSKYTKLFKGNYCKLSSDEKNKISAELDLAIEDIKYYIIEKQKEFDLETKKLLNNY